MPTGNETRQAFLRSAQLHADILGTKIAGYNWHGLGNISWHTTHWMEGADVEADVWESKGAWTALNVWKREVVNTDAEVYSICYAAGLLLTGSSEDEVIEYLESLIPTEPELPTGPIYSDFLSQGWMSLLLPAYPREIQISRLNQLKSRGFRDVDLYAFNQNDNPYMEPFWKIDATRSDALRDTLELARNTGLRPTVWCFADQLQGIDKDTAIDILDRWVRLHDDLITRYVFALEQNESWDSETARNIIVHLDTLTDKPLYIHLTRGKNFGTSYPVKGIYYQYESATIDGTVNETKDKRRKWHDAGKQFIASEFKPFPLGHQKARARGNAVDDLVDGRANG